MGQDVVHPRAGGLAEQAEVAPPDRIGVGGAVPDVVAGIVQRALAQQVDRADHVVPVALLEQRRHAVLAAGTKSASIPRRRSVSSRTNAQYASRSSSANSRQYGWSHMSSAWRKR